MIIIWYCLMLFNDHRLCMLLDNYWDGNQSIYVTVYQQTAIAAGHQKLTELTLEIENVRPTLQLK